MKTLKNIDTKNNQQLGAIREERGKQLDLIDKYSTEKEIGFYDKENKKSVKLIKKNNKIVQSNKSKSFVCTHSDGTQNDFNQYRVVNQFGNEIYDGKLSIEDAKDEQYEMKILINKLKRYIQLI